MRVIRDTVSELRGGGVKRRKTGVKVAEALDLIPGLGLSSLAVHRYDANVRILELRCALAQCIRVRHALSPNFRALQGHPAASKSERLHYEGI